MADKEEPGDRNKVQSDEMKYSRSLKRCTRTDCLRNKDVGKELNVCSTREKIKFFRNKWKSHLQRMENTSILLLAYDYYQLKGEDHKVVRDMSLEQENGPNP